SPDWPEEGKKWDFKIYSNVSSQFLLSWLHVNTIPGSFQFSLFEEDTLLVEDMRKASRYTFSYSSGFTKEFSIKAVQIFDETEPEFNLALAQNPIVTKDLDFYIFPSEPVDVLELTIADSSFPGNLIDDLNMIVHNDYKIKGPGTIPVKISGIDFNGNVGIDTFSISVSLIKPTSGGTASSADGHLNLLFPEGSIQKEMYTTVIRDRMTEMERGLILIQGYPADANITAKPITGAYQVGPSWMRINRAAKLSLKIKEAGRGVDFEHLGIFMKDGDKWKWISSKVLPEKRQIQANINTPGIYRVFEHPLIKSTVVHLPERFALNQNYPNPFNISTTIKYDLPEDGRVTIRIFNTLGQQIKILTDKFQQAGQYSIKWDGKNENRKVVASGVYLLYMKAGNFQGHRKMIVIK
ncbi:MAG: FlgD immunoglobulin-like domain containing protein, partial [Fidelibacterota bacterium]